MSPRLRTSHVWRTFPCLDKHGHVQRAQIWHFPLAQSRRCRTSSFFETAESRSIFGFLCLNLSFAFVELVYGMWTNSESFNNIHRRLPASCHADGGRVPFVPVLSLLLSATSADCQLTAACAPVKAGVLASPPIRFDASHAHLLRSMSSQHLPLCRPGAYNRLFPYVLRL
jgi:hypothetical protein